MLICSYGQDLLIQQKCCFLQSFRARKSGTLGIGVEVTRKSQRAGKVTFSQSAAQDDDESHMPLLLPGCLTLTWKE